MISFTRITNRKLISFLKVFAVFVCLCASFQAHAATLSLSPGTGVYTAGQTFSARVIVNTQGKPINAADGKISFNPNTLTVIGVAKGSIFGLWTAQPAFSNTNGSITFSGGTPSGYTGAAGTVLRVTFRAKSAGTAKVTFADGSVLAADGKGTNVLTSMNGSSYTISAANVEPTPETIRYVAPANTPDISQITSSTHPDSSAWYTATTAQLSWKLPSDVTAVRTLLDDHSGSIPSKIYDKPIDHISIPDLSEGVEYFHLQFKNKNGWGKVAHYRLAVDTKRPTSFDITLPDDADLSSPVQTVSLRVHDDTSAVRRYSVQLDGAEPYEYKDETGSSTMRLANLSPGYHTVIIEAFDQAGNSIVSTFSFTITAFDKPQFTEYPSQINGEVIPVIKGQTRPNASVVVTIKQLGLSSSDEDAVKTYKVESDDSGTFTVIPDGKLSLGVYELNAVATDVHGAQSDPSDSIRIAVQQPGYLRIGSLVVSILSVLIPLIGLSILLILGIWYLIFRIRRLRSAVSVEATEALSILSSEFDALQSELLKQQAALEKSRKTKKLTKAEQRLVETLSAALTKARQRVQKEVADVEDIVD